MTPRVAGYVGLDASEPMVTAFTARTTAAHPAAVARCQLLTAESAAALVTEFG